MVDVTTKAVSSFAASLPADVEIGPDGNVYVVNAGVEVRKYGPTGTSLGQFVALAGARGIAWADDGFAYVVSNSLDKVIKVDLLGNATDFITTGLNDARSIVVPEPGTLALLAISGLMALRRGRRR